MRFIDVLNSDGTINWGFVETIPEFKRLSETPQSTKWHKEGDVMAHTKLVVSEMEKLLEIKPVFRTLDTEDWFVKKGVNETALLLAALCHDLGKGTCTYWNEEEQDYKTNNHGLAGERITRKLFFEEPDILLREKVCWLVRWHMLLHHIFGKESLIQDRLYRIQIGTANVLEQCYLNWADSMGSISDESTNTPEKVSERLETILSTCSPNGLPQRTIAKKERFFDTYEWSPNRDDYGNMVTKSYDEETFETYREGTHSTVYYMMGISGSGKSTWLAKNHPELPVVSRDVVRAELGFIKPGEKAKLSKKQEEEVTKECLYRIGEYAKRKVDFAIDDMNLKKKYRVGLHRYLYPYAPDFVYVYVEAPSLDDNFERREEQVEKKQIEQMLTNLEFPEPYEYDELIISKQTEKGNK